MNANWIDDLNPTKSNLKSYMFNCCVPKQNNGNQNSANYFCRNIFTYDEFKKKTSTHKSITNKLPKPLTKSNTTKCSLKLICQLVK